MSPSLPTVKRRACVACTSAKSKCIPQSSTICQRCARLGKSCAYLDLPQTRRTNKTAPSRVEILERKVDQLTSQLATLTRHNGNLSLTTPTSQGESSYLPGYSDINSSDVASLLKAAEDPSHGPDRPRQSILDGQPSIVEQGLMTEEEAQYLLTAFQLTFMSRFPFVVLPYGEPAATLRSREPFLFLCILSATMATTHPLCRTVTEEIMKHVTSRIVINSERTLELLRGLLVHCAWYSYPAEKHHPRLLLLTQLSISIAYDLGLHRKSNRSLDEQRALLGAYWISIGLSGTLGRPKYMRHETYIDECLEGIAHGDLLSDRWIAPLIHLLSFQETMDDVYASLQSSGGNPLIQVTRSSLQRQLDTIRPSIDAVVRNCPSPTATVIQTEFQYAKLRLDELSLREELWIADPTSAIRVTMLMELIQRSKEIFEMVEAFPDLEITQMTIITCARICGAVGYVSHAALSLFKIQTLSAKPGTYVQIEAVVTPEEYVYLITQLARKLEGNIIGSSTLDKETDIVGSLCSKMRLLARAYPYQIKAILDSASSFNIRQEATIIGAHESQDATMSQTWPSVHGEIDDTFFPSDIDWNSLLGNFTNLN